MNYFEALGALLKTEQEEDRAQYRKLTEQSGAAERRANGLTWYPIAIRGIETTKGDYIQVEAERTTHHDVPHQLRFGMSAALFSNHDAKNNRIEGVISHQSGNRVKINFRTEELPDWADDGKLGIDVLFDDNSYEEMFRALKVALKKMEEKDGRLLQIITGDKEPTFNNTIAQYANAALNVSQNAAVNKILQANELAVVHGPPGTGKTTTIVQTIKELIQRGAKRILVTAPSNTAVDLLGEKISEQGINVLRIGNPARVTDRLLMLTLDSKMASHSDMKEMKQLKKQAQEFKNMAHKYKRSFGRAEREQRKLLFDEAHKIMKQVEQTEQYITEDVIGKAQVIAATLVGAAHYTVQHLQYDAVVIDEAGQALAPACLIPILKTQKVILAGDHCQLPPTIKSQEAAKKGLSKTLFEKCIALHPQAVSMLEEQYRMHENIMGYSSRVFYDNKLMAHHSVAKHLLFDEDSPLQFIDTAGCSFNEEADGTSIVNVEEAAFVIKHVVRLAETLKAHYTLKDFPSIGIISPYKQQIIILKEQLLHTPDAEAYRDKITVNTIDSFQGQERDIIYISLTRSNAEGEIGFLSDIRRMNVAMTRARKKLIVVGDSATLSQFPFYEQFITHAQETNAYFSAWEFMD